MIVSANWRLENAKSPAAMLQENYSDATRVGITRMYLVYCCICDVSKLVTAKLLSLG